MAIGAGMKSSGSSSYMGKGSTGGIWGNAHKITAPAAPAMPKQKEMIETTVRNTADDMFNKNIQAYQPTSSVTPTYVNNPRPVTAGTVYADKANASYVGRPDEMRQFEGSVNKAGQWVDQAGRMDPRIQEFLRASQQSGQYSPEAISMMKQAAAGQGPSAAQGQLRAGLDQAIKAQVAAAGARGFSAAGSRGAAMNAAEMQQAALNQSAQLRAQEQQAAQSQYLQAAMQQEQMQRQSAMQAAGLTLDSSVASQQAKQAAINAQLAASGQLAGMGLERSMTNAQLEQQAALANLDVGTRVALANQQAGLQADMATQDAWLRAQLANQDVGMKSQMFNNQLGYDAWQGAVNANLGYGGLGTGLISDLYKGTIGYDTAAAQRAHEGNMADVGFGRGLLTAAVGGLAQGAGSAMVTKSDKNAKKNIKPNNETMAFLEALTDNSYEYKEPNSLGSAPGRQYGPMAQDLEKTAMGRTAVIKDEEGTRMVDSARGFLLALSGLANVHKRLKALEA